MQLGLMKASMRCWQVLVASWYKQAVAVRTATGSSWPCLVQELHPAQEEAPVFELVTVCG
jgi:hypothetical protein